jgi:DNA-binding PadR family transcriptional regulator
MKQAALDSSGSVKLAPGTLYVNLKKLLEQQLIAEVGEQPDRIIHDSRRRYYCLTPQGRAALSAELERMRNLAELGAKYGVVRSAEAQS